MVFGPAEAFTPDQFIQQYDVNVLGAQRVNRAALPHLFGRLLAHSRGFNGYRPRSSCRLSLSAQEIASAISGMICTADGGARFVFGSDDRFAYDGLWQSRGSYTVSSNAVFVTFDSGLRRAFAISIRDGALYMEQTRVSCATGG